jgi:hypothetical protein
MSRTTMATTIKESFTHRGMRPSYGGRRAGGTPRERNLAVLISWTWIVREGDSERPAAA